MNFAMIFLQGVLKYYLPLEVHLLHHDFLPHHFPMTIEL